MNFTGQIINRCVCGIYENDFPCSVPLELLRRLGKEKPQRRKRPLLKDGMFAWETGSWHFMAKRGLLCHRCSPTQRYKAREHLQCETFTVWSYGLRAQLIAPRCCRPSNYANKGKGGRSIPSRCPQVNFSLSRWRTTLLNASWLAGVSLRQPQSG